MGGTFPPMTFKERRPPTILTCWCGPILLAGELHMLGSAILIAVVAACTLGRLIYMARMAKLR